MLTFLLVIVGLSILILVHEFGHFVAAKYFGLRVDEFGIGFPPRLFSMRRGETLYSVNALPFGGFVKIFGEEAGEREKETVSREASARSFAAQAPWKRTVITLAGIIMNFALGWMFLSAVFMVGTPPILVVSDVMVGSPAEAGGIRGGDIIKGYEKAGEFISLVQSNMGKTLSLIVLRDGEEVALSAVPRVVNGEGEGALGVLLVEGGIPKTKNPLLAMGRGFLSSLTIVKESIRAFYALLKTFVFEASLLEGIVGPVGIVGVAAGAGKLGGIYLVQLLAIISLNLAVLNLIPFPALDGGRIAFIGIEKIKGSPISKKTEAITNSVGFLLLLVLMAMITVRDIGQLW